MQRAFLFPGQGSQAVGMGRDLAAASPAARAVFEEVDEALGERLSALMFDGPDETLTLTANAQPAIMAVSMAVVRLLEAEAGVRVSSHCAYVAGHSLGEYSALCAAGALPLAETARLLRRRGQAMQAAVAQGVGAMAALIAIPWETVVEVAAEAQAASPGEVCAAANDNAPGQVVVSGHLNAVRRAINIAKTRGARHAVLLPVSAPFHCPLMAPAADAMAHALAATRLDAPNVAIVTNVTARPQTDPSAIRDGLVEQVTATVRWRESVAWMAGDGGVEEFVELGAKVVGPMVKRIAPDAGQLSLTTMEEIEAWLKTL
jgi:[acyl-carrier-protein] S-malonyltransferase